MMSQAQTPSEPPLPSAAQRFVDRIRALVQEHPTGEFARIQLVALNARHDAAVVLYAERPDGPVLGRQYVLEEFARLFEPALTPEQLADIALSDDIVDPSGPGQQLEVDWAERLVDEPERVLWHV